MARTIAEIYDALIDEKENQASLNALVPNPDSAQTLLADLTSNSKVAIWRLWYFVVAVAIFVHEGIFDQFRLEVDARADELITGTARWYRDQALLFQNGDSLVYNETLKRFEYSPVVPANRIIERVAVIDTSAQVRIKVAKLDGTGTPIPLTAPEKAAFESYLNQIKFAGTSTAVTSAVADDIKLDVFVQYNPQILASDGSRLDDPAIFPLVDAINGYIQNIPFNGVLNVTGLVDAMQAADGIIDPVINSIQAKFGALPYSEIDKNYLADAGHLALDTGASTFTYSTQTTF